MQADLKFKVQLLHIGIAYGTGYFHIGRNSFHTWKENICLFDTLCSLIGKNVSAKAKIKSSVRTAKVTTEARIKNKIKKIKNNKKRISPGEERCNSWGTTIRWNKT